MYKISGFILITAVCVSPLAARGGVHVNPIRAPIEHPVRTPVLEGDRVLPRENVIDNPVIDRPVRVDPYLRDNRIENRRLEDLDNPVYIPPEGSTIIEDDSGLPQEPPVESTNVPLQPSPPPPAPAPKAPNVQIE